MDKIFHSRLMEKESSVTPIIMVQVLHNAFPRFAERSQGGEGGFQQQDANECWVELMNLIKKKLKNNDG